MVWTPDINIPRTVVASGVIVLVAAVMTLGVAGVLTGTGLFILGMLSGDVSMVVASSLVFAVSLAILLSCYLWLTA